MTSTDQITELERVLSQEIELYESYATQLANDADLMTRMKIEELEQSNKAKATILLKIETLDQLRQRIVHEVAQNFGIAEEKVRITDICEHLEEEKSTSLLNLRKRLHAVTEQIRHIQSEASSFVNTSLSWIDGSMSTLKRLLTPTGTYNAQGRVDHPSSFAGRTVENKA